MLNIILLVLLTACRGDLLPELGDTTQGEKEGNTDVAGIPVEEREKVEISFVASMGENGEVTSAQRVSAQPEGTGIRFEWEANETLGVYIKHADKRISYAGSVSTTEDAGAGVREFTGSVSALENNEQYVYVSPLLTETQGAVAVGAIAYATQNGELNSTAHLRSLIPLVWYDNGEDVLVAQKQAYVVRLLMAFGENPGEIREVKLHTMKMGDDGTTADRVFPKKFKTANLANTVNNTLANEKTAGTDPSLSDESYTDEITLTITTPVAPVQNGSVWRTEVYLAVPSIENLDVFRTKYNVEVTAANDTYYSDYRSFPGQGSATASTGLKMLSDGKCYNLNAIMSKGAAMTIISENYKVISLLGMWNQYGKPYDPFGLVVYDGESDVSGASIPAQLKSNKDAILSRYANNGVGTPTWLGVGDGSLYDKTAVAYSNNYRQDNVIINNIEITRPTEVFVTFISEYGWNENLLGYYHYSGLDPDESREVTKILVFPNVSKPNHQPFNLDGSGSGSTTTLANIGTPAQAPLREFETVKLLYTDPETGLTSTTFPTGTIIGFMMMIDTEAQEQTPNAGYDLLKWSQWRLFTNTTWNKENTRANGAAADWPTSPGYTRWNYFCSGDVCKDATPIPGLAIYGIKDTGNNDANTAYGAMIFMVSTSDPSAMETWNKCYFNIGTGDRVVDK